MAHPFYNRTTGDILSILKHDPIAIDDVFIERGLVANQLIDAISSPVIPELVGYTTEVDNGFFSIDGTGLITMTKSGLYSVSITTCFDETGRDGSRQHYLELDRAATKKVFGFCTAKSTAQAPATNMGTAINSSITLGLNVGDVLEHRVASFNTSGTPFQCELIGTASSSVTYTRITFVFLSL